MKKIIAMSLILVLMLSISTTAFAGTLSASETKVGLVINGKIQTWDENDFGKLFVTNNGRTMVPVRIISELLGYSVKWEGIKKEVTISKDDESVVFPIGAYEITTKNGVIKMEEAATVINGRTYLPIRFVGDALGAEVDWKKYTEVDGGRNGNKDFYVTVVTTGTTNPTTTVADKYDFVKNPVFKEMIDAVPSSMPTLLGETYLLIGADNMMDTSSAYLDISRVDDEMIIIVSNPNVAGVAETLKGSLNVFAKSTDDANYIYNLFLPFKDTIADNKWVKAKDGTEFTFVLSYGQWATIKIKY